jgi:hypothetical protein
LTCWCAVSRSGALSSAQRTPFSQRPVVVVLLAWAFQSARRTWLTASLASLM